ncbi:MAG: family 4 glycosyl hydrolase [Promethearchaeota archaeon]
MTERLKLAYIGAGSFRFSRGLFSNIVATQELMPMHIALVDIDEKALNIMYGIFKRMVKKAKKIARKNGWELDVTFSKHTDRREALENCDFIYKSISVGIQKSEWVDIHIPFQLGIPQNTGDTVGPGGLFRGLRCAPVAYNIAKDMKEFCPKAVLLNYTNPQATIVMGARRVDPNIQFIGLCHELFGGMGSVAEFFVKQKGLKIPHWTKMDFKYGGVNHFAWLTELSFDGKDLYEDLRKSQKWLEQNKFKGRTFNWYLMGIYNYYPYPGSRHVAEFIPKYYNYFNHKEQKDIWGFPVLRNVKALDLARRGTYVGFKLQSKGLIPVPGPTKKGERAMEMTIDWRDSNPTQHVVNLPNKGYIPNLPEDSIVEIPGYFKDGIMHGIKVGDLPNAIADLVRPHCEVQKLTVDAALKCDLDLLYKAAKRDSMCAFIEDDERIERMVDLMLYYEQEWLPEEWKESIKSLDELKNSKYFVSKKELHSKNVSKIVKYPPRSEIAEKSYKF